MPVSFALFSGANHFGDLAIATLSSEMGFSGGKIHATVGPEIERLRRDGMQGRTADDALHELARWVLAIAGRDWRSRRSVAEAAC